jgi:2-polyprenyl-3-methyl-5-hydroxy-6-metoxy-1,4-benzoquinol methylase
MRFAHTLPRAEFVGSKSATLVRLCGGKRVLHLGFVAEGFLEDQLQRQKWLHAEIAQVASKLVGVDISEQGVRRAGQLGFADCYVGDVEQLSRVPFPRLDYDVILAPDIIEHLANPGLFLNELSKVTTENSLVVISTPNALSIKTLFFPLARTEAVHPDHNFYYSPTTLTTLLRKYGFRVTDIGLYSGIWVRNKQNSHSFGELIAKSLFTGLDAVLRYSVVPLFPYFSEGMVVQAKKQGQAPTQEGSL